MYRDKQNGFTIIELIVAIALLGVIVASSGMIFRISIETQRKALGNAEIMQKFRAISLQLDSDFENFQKDAPLIIWFQHDPNSQDRFDKVMFFTTGDFQSTQRYRQGQEAPLAYQKEVYYQEDSKNVRGNTARIYYGLANLKKNFTIEMPQQMNERERILSRRQHILTADTDFVEWPDEDLSDFDALDLDASVSLAMNDRYEHDRLSLTKWKNIEAEDYDSVLETVFLNTTSWIDLGGDYQPYTIHNLMCEGVGSFAIQWAYWDDSSSTPDGERIRWFPAADLDGDTSSTQDSHFSFNPGKIYGQRAFGVLFKVSGDADFIGENEDWKKIEHLEYKESGDNNFNDGFYPKALKFTIRIYDSKNIIKDGRTFTKIVYLDK